MTVRRLPFTDLPGWPLYLTRQQAAAYLGVSPDVFDAEVKAGVWHPGVRRGAKGALVTWDRLKLERERPSRDDIDLNIVSPQKADLPANDWKGRFSGAAKKRRTKAGHAAA